MYSVILLAIVFPAIIYFVTKKHNEVFLFMFFALVAGIFVGILVGDTLTCLQPKEIVSSKPITLAAMRSSDNLHGTFLFGSGSISEGSQYKFMERDNDGSFVQGSINVSPLVHVVEDPNLQNAGYWITTKKVSIKPTGFTIQFFSFNPKPNGTILREEFRVPVGTVIQQFSIK